MVVKPMDIASLLTAQGIQWIDKGGNEFAVPCPNQAAHHGGFDADPSFFINSEKLVGHCFACGLKMGEVSLMNWLGHGTLDELQTQTIQLRSRLNKLQTPSDIPSITEESFTLVPPSTPFREDYRGIAKSTYEALNARKCNVGRYANRMFFEIWQKGILLGIDARALASDMKPKYLRNKGADAKKWLWPQDYWKPRKPKFICLAEGCFHAVNGVDKDTPILCFYGVNNFSEENILDVLALNVDYVVYFGDNDKPGIEAREHITQLLSPWVPTYYVPEESLPEGKDAGDLTKDEMDYCLQVKKKVR